MVVLGLWLSSVEPEKLLESVLVEKLLEILSRLTFTVDLLVKYKFGRVIKKITQQKVTVQLKPTNFEMASKLFEEWSEMANKPEIPVVPRRKSEDSTNDVDVATTIAQTHSLPDVKPEEVIAKVAAKTVLKRPSPDVKNDDTKRAKTAFKKSVRFPDSVEELCKVILFERDPEEYEYLSDGSASRDSYLHADKGEALAAFEHSNDSDESLESPSIFLKPWKQLLALEGVPLDRPEGIESEEKIIQHQRERTVLSINFYSLSEVPFSPSEVDVDDISSEDPPHYKTIQIRSNETIVKHSFKFTSNSSIQSLEISSLFSPNMMNNFIPSGSTFTDLLNPFSNGKSKVEPSLQNPTNSSPRIDLSLNSFRSSLESEPVSGYSSKTICRHYRPGKARSCWLGSNCKFLHQD